MSDTWFGEIVSHVPAVAVLLPLLALLHPHVLLGLTRAAVDSPSCPALLPRPREVPQEPIRSVFTPAAVLFSPAQIFGSCLEFPTLPWFLPVLAGCLSDHQGP